MDDDQEYRWFDYKDGDFYQDEMARKALAMMFCYSGWSLKDSLLINGLHDLNPKFKYHYNSVKADCLTLYKLKRDQLKEILTNLNGQVSLTVEVLANLYVSIKVHYLDENWKLQEWVLGFNMDDGVEGSVIKSLFDYGIWNKVATITFQCDQIYGDDDLFDDIKKSMQEKKQLQLNGKLFHVYCCAGLFKEMVNGALEEIPEIIQKVSEFTHFGKKSYSWSLTYKFLTEALKLESEGEFNKADYDIYYEKLTADEWTKVEDICKIVGYVHDVANILFETKNPTANIYFHRLQSLSEQLSYEAKSSNCLRSSVAQKMMVKFDKYWKDMFMVLALAAVMDPRLKMNFIEFSSSKHNSESYNVSTVMEALRDLYNGYTKTDVTFPELDEERSKKKQKQCDIIYMDWMNEFKEFTITTTTSPQVKSDLELYLEKPIVPWNEKFDVLGWWKKNSLKYPIVSKLARDILAIPLSVVRSYDAFLTVEREVSSDKLGNELKNALMCTSDWYKDMPSEIIHFVLAESRINIPCYYAILL